ncbi:GIY-YIG nuclease family protein [Candidatus Wolfebacteria bacterium]|nr:GIY-YIG nuclease family protein [Candidatus Wolfebacteria bacterium]
MFFYTYVLRSNKDDRNYIGCTNNLRRRIEEHNRGKNFSTKNRTPFQLIYFEACRSEEDAKQREKYLKSTVGRRFLKKRLRRYFN